MKTIMTSSLRVMVMGGENTGKSGEWFFFSKRFIDFVLFVCLEFFVPLENVSLIWRRSRAAIFDLCSVPRAIVQ